MKQKLNELLVLMSVLTLFPAASFAVSPSGNGWTLNRSNDAGSFVTQMAPSNTAFCFLIKVGVTETDTSAETVDCIVKRGAFAWTLEAKLGTTSDADVRCQAYCYNN